MGRRCNRKPTRWILSLRPTTGKHRCTPLPAHSPNNSHRCTGREMCQYRIHYTESSRGRRVGIESPTKIQEMKIIGCQNQHWFIRPTPSCDQTNITYFEITRLPKSYRRLFLLEVKNVFLSNRRSQTCPPLPPTPHPQTNRKTFRNKEGFDPGIRPTHAAVNHEETTERRLFFFREGDACSPSVASRDEVLR